MANEIDRRANKNKRDLTPAEKANGAALAKREMEVMQAGAKVQSKGGGSKEMEKAMNEKRLALKAKAYGRATRKNPGY